MSPSPGWKREDRARKAESFARKPGKRPPKPLILIVCEDSVSAPGYFQDMKTHLRVSTVEIEIRGKECGSAPISVVDYAINHVKDRKRQGHIIDIVYCVVDVDTHTSLARAKNKSVPHGLRCIVSSPCFERWYLVHFEPGDRPHKSYASLVSHLKAYLPDYDKGKSRPFGQTWDKVDTAITNARRLCAARDEDSARTSYTEVHEIVEKLRALAAPQTDTKAST